MSKVIRLSPFAEAWLEELSPSAIEQLAIVKDLLRHANEDSMSAGDRLICAEALKVLPERAKAEQNRLRDRQKVKEEATHVDDHRVQTERQGADVLPNSELQHEG